MKTKDKLEKQITELEKKISRSNLGKVFDRATLKKDENRLTKLRKELEKLQQKD